MSKHTPGPWRISSESKRIITVDYREIGHDGGELIGSAAGHPNSGFYPPDDQADANALLMAAAPDLLAALQLIYAFDVYEDSYQQLEDIVLDKTCDLGDRQKAAAFIAARAAISKATGETK